MIQIRNSIFETNSSSVHSITMCMNDEYERWSNGELYFCPYGGDKKFITKEEALNNVTESRRKYFPSTIYGPIDDKVLMEHEIYSRDCFWNDAFYEYETFEKRFTTPNGESIVAFGYFGSDY